MPSPEDFSALIRGIGGTVHEEFVERGGTPYARIELFQDHYPQTREYRTNIQITPHERYGGNRTGISFAFPEETLYDYSCSQATRVRDGIVTRARELMDEYFRSPSYIRARDFQEFGAFAQPADFATVFAAIGTSARTTADAFSALGRTMLAHPISVRADELKVLRVDLPDEVPPKRTVRNSQREEVQVQTKHRILRIKNCN
jgi:hypothetical protein